MKMTFLRSLSRLTTPLFISSGLVLFLSLPFYVQASGKRCSTVVSPSQKTKDLPVVQADGSVRISSDLGKLFIDLAKTQQSSTTGNRTELKRTLTSEKLQTALAKLNKVIPLKPRDEVTPGRRNVTVTDYLNTLRYDFEGQKVSTKIRFRKYGTIRNDLPIALEHVEYIPSTLQHAFMEFKTDRPDIPGAVYKTRAIVPDSIRSRINTPQFRTQFPQILKDALVMANDKPEAVEMTTGKLKVTRSLHEAGVPLKTMSRTLYTRTSLATQVFDPVRQKTYELQFTIDEEIVLWSHLRNRAVPGYRNEKPLVVVEVKIPVEIIDLQTRGLTQEILTSVPSLRGVQDFINELTDAQAPGYVLDKGKQFQIKFQIEQSDLAEQLSIF